jgi:hypothetical protein
MLLEWSSQKWLYDWEVLRIGKARNGYRKLAGNPEVKQLEGLGIDEMMTQVLNLVRKRQDMKMLPDSCASLHDPVTGWLLLEV